MTELPPDKSVTTMTNVVDTTGLNFLCEAAQFLLPINKVILRCRMSDSNDESLPTLEIDPSYDGDIDPAELQYGNEFGDRVYPHRGPTPKGPFTCTLCPGLAPQVNLTSFKRHLAGHGQRFGPTWAHIEAIPPYILPAALKKKKLQSLNKRQRERLQQIDSHPATTVSSDDLTNSSKMLPPVHTVSARRSRRDQAPVRPLLDLVIPQYSTSQWRPPPRRHVRSTSESIRETPGHPGPIRSASVASPTCCTTSTASTAVLSDVFPASPMLSKLCSGKRRSPAPFLTTEGADLCDLSPPPNITISPPREFPPSMKFCALQDDVTVSNNDPSHSKRLKRGKDKSPSPFSPSTSLSSPIAAVPHVIHRKSKNKRTQCSPPGFRSVRSQTDKLTASSLSNMATVPSAGVANFVPTDHLPSFWSPRSISQLAYNYKNATAAWILDKMIESTPVQFQPLSSTHRTSMELCLHSAMWAQRDMAAQILHQDSRVPQADVQQFRSDLTSLSVRPVDGPALLFPTPPLQAMTSHHPILSPWIAPSSTSFAGVPVAPTMVDLFKNVTTTLATSSAVLEDLNLESTPDVNISTDSLPAQTFSVDLLGSSFNTADTFLMEVEGDSVFVTRSDEQAEMDPVQSDAIDSQEED